MPSHSVQLAFVHDGLALVLADLPRLLQMRYNIVQVKDRMTIDVVNRMYCTDYRYNRMNV